MASFLETWLPVAFPVQRVQPKEGDVKSLQQVYSMVFGTPAGQELIQHWLESVVLANPRSTDPNECIAFAAKAAFVEDIIKALDRANNPAKYEARR